MASGATPIGLPTTMSSDLFYDTFGSEIIAVIVAGRKYSVHKRIICSVSDFFKAAIDGEFKESHTQEVVLEDTTSSAFDLLLQRLYTGLLPSQLLTQDTGNVSNHKYPEKIAEYYSLIDGLLLPSEFRTEALDSWTRLKLGANIAVGAHTLRGLLEQIPEPDPAHTLVLDFAAYEYNFTGKKDLLDDWFPHCSDTQKKQFAESLGRCVSNYVNPQNRLKTDHIRAVMGMESFTSIADMPRYQVGYLSRGQTGAAKKRGNRPQK